MKILRKSFLVGVFALLATMFAWVSPSTKTTNAVFSTEMFEYITITKQDQVITAENFIETSTDSYLVSLGPAVIHLKPFQYSYSVNESLIDMEHFIPNVDKFEFEYNPLTETYANEFNYDGVDYTYQVTRTGALTIYNKETNSSVMTSDNSDTNTVRYIQDDVNQTFTIYYTKSYTLKTGYDRTEFTFSVIRNGYTRIYSISFIEALNFKNTPFVQYTCTGGDIGDAENVDTDIEDERTYNTVKLDFLVNDYSEENPLYFNINYNGFTYNFELFSKVYDSKNLLFVNYKDPAKENTVVYLATKFLKGDGGELVLNTSAMIPAEYNEETNTFSITFKHTGRYEIEFYDSTYVAGMKDSNYDTTSFYILDKNQTAFDNIYMISQIFDDNNNPIEYIVSTSTLNYTVKTTIKNMNIPNLSDVIDKVEYIKTTFGGSDNIPTPEVFSAEDIKKKINSNGDFVLTFDEDAYYKITIYQKGTKNTHSYEFTIVKHAKTTFTIPLVDENGEPVMENGVQASTTDDASVPYKTETKKYSKNILANLDLFFEIKSRNGLEDGEPTTLDKTYINNYTVSYGMEQILIESFERKLEEGEEKVDELNIRVFGVGDMKVEVTVNGKTTIYELNSEKNLNTLRFTDYGTYQIRVIDSMGTESVKIFALQKKLNTSAIALIVLSSIIVAVVTIFVLKARSKLPTR